MIPPLPPLALDDDQISALQNLEVLHDRAAIQRPKPLAQRPRRLGRILQRIQHFATDTSRKGLENTVLIRFG